MYSLEPELPDNTGSGSGDFETRKFVSKASRLSGAQNQGERKTGTDCKVL